MNTPTPVKIDVTAVLETQKIGPFLINATCWLTLIMFFDGYNIQALSYAAPAIARSWGVGQSTLGVIFSLTLAGALLGAVIFGIISDRFGRKPAIIAAAMIFGVIAIVTCFASNVTELGTLRCLGGIAIGGLAPAGQALAAELAPTRYRATLVTLVMSGFILGISAGGLVALLIPRFGWQIIFLFGGVSSLVAASCLIFSLSESLRFLVVNGQSRVKIERILVKMGAVVGTSAEAVYVASDEAPSRQGKKIQFSMLFQGRLRWITPLWCLTCMLGSMETNALMNWMPTLVERQAIAFSSASLALTLFSLAGLLGSLVLMRFVDRFGSIVIAAMPLTAAPLIASLGLSGLSSAAYMVIIFLAGFFILGGHFCITAVGGVFYPSTCRAKGYAVATVVGRTGGIIGPFVGGELLSHDIAMRELFSIYGAVPLFIAAAVFALGIQHRMLRRERIAPVHAG